MTMHDWNNNDKHDWQDNFVAYQIYRDVTGQRDDQSYTPSRDNGMFRFVAIISVIAGLFI